MLMLRSLYVTITLAHKVTRKASRIAGLHKEKKGGGKNPAYRIVVLSQVGGGSSGKPSYMCVEGRNVQLVEDEV